MEFATGVKEIQEKLDLVERRSGIPPEPTPQLTSKKPINLEIVRSGLVEGIEPSAPSSKAGPFFGASPFQVQ